MDSGPSEYQALNNDLILDMILSNLKTPDLLCCRMVNQKWNKGATSILKRRPVHLKAVVGVAREYDELFNLMKSSPDFPFRGFGFTVDRPWKLKRKSIDTVAARRFFGKFGPHFHYLHLRSAYLRSRDLMALLCVFLPNMRVIELGISSIQHEKEGGLQNMSLPALRVIRLRAPRHPPFLEYPIPGSDFAALLCAATNLEKIEGDLSTAEDNEGILSAISVTKNWDKVSNLTLEYHVEVNASVYKALTLNAPSALTQLNLDYLREEGDEMLGVSAEFTECVRAVLLSSAETLKSLVIGKVTLPMHQLPTMFPKLSTLEFKQKDVYYNVVSPGISDHHEKFPALNKIRLNLEYMTRGLLREKFWNEGTAWSSVVKLDFHCQVSPPGIKHLAKVFPSVSHIVIHFPQFFGKDKDNLSRIIDLKEFRALEILEIVDVGEGYFDLHLDELLTGFPLSVCRKLRRSMKQKLCEGCSEVLRPFGGIVHLRGTNLKELVIYCNSGLHHRDAGKGDPFISKASVWYGLEMIPGLRTVLKVPNKAEDFAARLHELVEKFVTIDNL